MIQLYISLIYIYGFLIVYSFRVSIYVLNVIIKQYLCIVNQVTNKTEYEYKTLRHMRTNEYK